MKDYRIENPWVGSTPFDEAPVGECANCGGEIYEGEDVYKIGDDIIHRDIDELEEFTGAKKGQLFKDGFER